jgi:hypothetical protein
MTKIIKKAAIVFPTYTKGQTITWGQSSFDGRGYVYDEYKGTITRVNKITVTAQDTEGNTWSVDKTDIKK